MGRWPNTRQPDWAWWRELWPDPAGVLHRLGLRSGTSLADVGCGNGYFTLAAARLVDPAPVYAVDIDADLLVGLESRVATAGVDNVVSVEGDARALDDLLPEPVDTVLVANTFHGIEDPASFARAAGRSLTTAGRLVVINWHARPRRATRVAGQPRGPPTDRRLSPEETEKAVSSAGFEPVETIELPPHHYGLVLER